MTDTPPTPEVTPEPPAPAPRPHIPIARQVSVSANLGKRRVMVQIGADVMELTTKQAREFALSLRQGANRVERHAKGMPPNG